MVVLLVKKVLESGTVCPQRHEASMANGYFIVSQMSAVQQSDPKGCRQYELNYSAFAKRAHDTLIWKTEKFANFVPFGKLII
jgi:hypothetical protein